MAELSVQEEKFVQCIASGMTQSDAYRTTFDVSNWKSNSIWTEASLLAKKPEVRQRLQELGIQAAAKTNWTLERLIEEFEEVKDMCKVAKPVYDMNGIPTGEYKFDSTGAVNSLKNIGELCGFYVQKHQISGGINIKVNPPNFNTSNDSKDDDFFG